MKFDREKVLERKAVANFRRRALHRVARRVVSSNRAVREKLWKLQGGRCAGLVTSGRYIPCSNKILPNALCDCDHIVEIRHGGQDDFANLQLLCRWKCHRNKTTLNRLSQRVY